MPAELIMYFIKTYYKWTFVVLFTSVLQAGDVGFQLGLRVPILVSGTGAQLLAEVLLNHTQVI